MTGEVVEILFLLENVGLRVLFAAGKTPKNDRAIHLCGKLGAAFRVDAIGFALATLLGLYAGCEAD